MSQETKYHIVPTEEDNGRPSMDSVSDVSQPLIHASRSPSPDTAPIRHVSKKRKHKEVGFHALHITFLFRLLAFIFHLTAVLLLGINARNRNAVASIVFLSIAMARNLFIIVCYLFSKCFTVDIRLSIDGVNTGKSPKWIKSRLLPLFIDLTILITLLICLSISFARGRHGYYWRGNSEAQNDGFAVAFTGLAMYGLSILDFGDPKSISVIALLSIKRNQGAAEADADAGEIYLP